MSVSHYVSKNHIAVQSNKFQWLMWSIGWNSMYKIWFINGCALSIQQIHFHVWIWIFEHPSVNELIRWNECNGNWWDEDWLMKPTIPHPKKRERILMCKYKRIFHGWTKNLMDRCDIVRWSEVKEYPGMNGMTVDGWIWILHPRVTLIIFWSHVQQRTNCFRAAIEVRMSIC
jgi:hypothetical protein